MQVATVNANSKRNDWCKGTTPTYKITDEVAVFNNADGKWFVCDKDDRDAAREVTLDELKVLLAKPLTFIFWRAKASLMLLKTLGLPVPEKWECAYTQTYLLTDGSTKVMNLDRAVDWYYEDGIPDNDLQRAFCLWWMHSHDLEENAALMTRYKREIENIRRALTNQPQQ